MRTLIVLLLPLCFLYFAIGLILVWTQTIDQQTYLNGAGIVGGLASVLGLLSFLRPALTNVDIKNIETDSLAKLGEISSEIKELEKARHEAATEINHLEVQKKEMEFLVRKASMSLFLKDQYEHHEKKVLAFLKKQPEALESIAELIATDKKLIALNEEIEKDENVEVLKEIISVSKTTPSALDQAIENASSNTNKIFLQIVRIYVEAFKRYF